MGYRKHRNEVWFPKIPKSLGTGGFENSDLCELQRCGGVGRYNSSLRNFTYARVHMHVHTCVCTRAYARMHACICTCARVHMHACACICTAQIRIEPFLDLLYLFGLLSLQSLLCLLRLLGLLNPSFKSLKSFGTFGSCLLDLKSFKSLNHLSLRPRVSKSFCSFLLCLFTLLHL